MYWVLLTESKLISKCTVTNQIDLTEHMCLIGKYNRDLLKSCLSRQNCTKISKEGNTDAKRKCKYVNKKSESNHILALLKHLKQVQSPPKICEIHTWRSRKVGQEELYMVTI